ncbi:MAG: hypothetical protein H7Y01_01330 [Ferruginibacter sp.]|nr:hypothetical protein [Chitinophagaceae bacterium]
MHRIFYLLLLLILSRQISGQQAPYKFIPPQYELEHIKLNNKEDLGLFNDIKEDKEGYLWLSGTKGLSVFDGHTTITYANGNKAFGLGHYTGNNSFGYFSPDQDGNFWIASDSRRFIKLDPARRTIIDSFSLDADLDARYFRIAQNSDDGFFFTQRNDNKEERVSLYRRKEKEGHQELFQLDVKPDKHFYYYLAGNDHWFLQDGELTRVSLDGKKVKQYAYPGKDGLSFFVQTSKGSIYFTGSKQEAIYTWNAVNDKIELFLTLPSYISSKLHTFYIGDDLVYVGSNLNLFIIDRSVHTIQDLSPQFTELVKKEAPGSLSEPLNCIFRQKGDAILLETLTNIYRLKKKVPPDDQFRQQVEINTNGSFSKLVSFRALAEDEHQNIYSSYYTGISKRPDGKTLFSPLPVTQYMKGELVSTYSLHYWNDHLLWNNVKIEIGTGKFAYLFDSTFSGHCTQFLQHDSLWLFKWGTKTLHCFDLLHNTLSSYPLQIELPATNAIGAIGDINDIIADASGENLWIGSRDLGLCLITKKGKLVKQYRHNELGISDDYITDLERVGEQLWFGCTDGLGVLNTASGKLGIYKNPVIENGLQKNRAVFSIQPDSSGNFYLGSSYGLLYFDTHGATFYNLPEGHPLSTVEFNRAAVLRTSNNRYYFGSTDGLFSFTPGELEFVRSSYAIKPVKLFGISIFNSRDNVYRYVYENLDSLGKLVLYPFDNNIQLSFSVPEFYRDVYYSYRIKGQGDNWTEYRPDNKIVLTGFQPGDYLLEVKVSTGLDDSNASYYTLPVTMKQVWYKKPWVIALLSLVMIALLVLYLRSRFNQKLKRQKDLADLRTKISSDLHDDVGTILSGLAMQSQVLTYTAREEQKESLNEISTMSREAMEHMRDTVWAMDSRKDKYENLIDRMRAYAEKNLAMKSITHEFTISDIDTKKFINPGKRQAIYLIFKEAITNIIKHSDGRHVKISFTEEKNKLRLLVQDTGTLKPLSNSDGLGLSNMKMRAEKIGGELNTGYDKGYWVSLIIS